MRRIIFEREVDKVGDEGRERLILRVLELRDRFERVRASWRKIARDLGDAAAFPTLTPRELEPWRAAARELGVAHQLPWLLPNEPPQMGVRPRQLKRSRRSKQRQESQSASKPKPLLAPRLLQIEDSRAVCRYGTRTIQLPITQELVQLRDGLTVTVNRVATTRFRGFILSMEVEVPNKPRKSRRAANLELRGKEVIRDRI